jgi:FtsK/SpoIIIE family
MLNRFRQQPDNFDWILAVTPEYASRIKTLAERDALIQAVAPMPVQYRIGLLANLWSAAMTTGGSWEEYRAWGENSLGLDANALRQVQAMTEPKQNPQDYQAQPKTRPVLGPLDQQGEAMANAYRSMGTPVTFIPPAIDSTRHCSFTFQLQPGQRFSVLKRDVQEAISIAGHDPEVMAQVRPMSKLQVQIYVPKPPEQWRSISLLSHLCNEHGVDEPDPGKRAYKLILKLSNLKKKGLLKIPVGYNTQNELVSFECLTGLKVIGGSRGGKSNTVKAVVSWLLLNYKPEELGLAFVDMKNVTFSRYKDLACLVHPIVNALNFRSEYPRMVAAISEEYAKRNAAMLASKSEDWLEHGKTTGEAMKPIIIVFDEVALAVAEEEIILDWLIKVASTYAHAGIYLVLITQYGVTFPTRLRYNINAAIGFKSEAKAAAYTFRAQSPIKLIEGLLGFGDCVVEASNLLSPDRVQAFACPPEHRDAVLEQYTAFYPTKPTYLPVNPELVEPFPEKEKKSKRRSEAEEVLDDVLDGGVQCPNCGSQNCNSKDASRWRCKDCNTTFPKQ